MFVCLLVCNRGDIVSTGSGQRQALSRQGSLVNPLYQVAAVTAESFMVPVIDVFLTPQYDN